MPFIQEQLVWSAKVGGTDLYRQIANARLGGIVETPLGFVIVDAWRDNDGTGSSMEIIYAGKKFLRILTHVALSKKAICRAANVFAKDVAAGKVERHRFGTNGDSVRHEPRSKAARKAKELGEPETIIPPLWISRHASGGARKTG